MAGRFSGVGQPYEGLTTKDSNGKAKWNGTIKLVHDKMADPLHWQRPRMIFVNSMSDLFHESVPDEFVDQVFAVMALAKQHTFQVLTKRPERMLDYLRSSAIRDKWVRAGDAFAYSICPQRYANLSHIGEPGNKMSVFTQFPLPNVWLGVTVENQQAADERIPLLLQTPAAVRWVSMEPLLGPVDLGYAFGTGSGSCPMHLAGVAPEGLLPKGEHHLHWVVVGGESGPNARPMHPDWARSLRDQCADAGVPFLFKQWGEWAPTVMEAGKHLPFDQRSALRGDDIAGTVFGAPGKRFIWPTIRVGKKAAGRLLDGVLHDGYPEAGL